MTIQECGAKAQSIGDLAKDIINGISDADLGVPKSVIVAEKNLDRPLDALLTDAMAMSGVALTNALEATLPLAVKASDSLAAAVAHATAAESVAKYGRLYLAASLLIRAAEETVHLEGSYPEMNVSATRTIYEASKLIWG